MQAVVLFVHTVIQNVIYSHNKLEYQVTELSGLHFPLVQNLCFVLLNLTEGGGSLLDVLSNWFK